MRTQRSVSTWKASAHGHKLVELVDGRTFTCRTLVFATGTYLTTSGSPHLPINPHEVENGSLIMHSSDFSSNRGRFLAAPRRFLIGASKAAVDILQTLSPEDPGFVWAHRGEPSQ